MNYTCTLCSTHALGHFCPGEPIAIPVAADKIAALQAALDEANTDRERLQERFAREAAISDRTADMADALEAERDRAVAQIRRIEAWRDQLIANRGGWDVEIGQHLTELLAGQDSGDSDGA